jgi:hypothetical protein
MLTALNTVGIAVQPFTFYVQVAPSASTQFEQPVHVPGGTFTTPALNWSGGDEDTL